MFSALEKIINYQKQKDFTQREEQEKKANKAKEEAEQEAERHAQERKRLIASFRGSLNELTLTLKNSPTLSKEQKKALTDLIWKATDLWWDDLQNERIANLTAIINWANDIANNREPSEQAFEILKQELESSSVFDKKIMQFIIAITLSACAILFSALLVYFLVFFPPLVTVSAPVFLFCLTQKLILTAGSGILAAYSGAGALAGGILPLLGCLPPNHFSKEIKQVGKLFPSSQSQVESSEEPAAFTEVDARPGA